MAKREEREYVKATRKRGKPSRATAIVTLARLREELDDPKDVLKQIGALIVTQTQRTFTNQRSPSGKPWLERYPSQDGPKLNVAGALSDFNKGATTLGSKRFKGRPALVNTGKLKSEWNSKAERTTIKSKYVVVVGVSEGVAPYASRMQEGTASTQDITSTGKKSIYAFIKANKKNKKGEAVSEHMGWMLNKYTKPTTLETTPVARVFLEIVPETERKIKRAVEQVIEKKLKSRG